MKVPGHEGIWEQMENADDIYTMENAFRALAPSGDTQRILTFLSPSKFLDFFEQNSDVPVAPYPRVTEASMDVNWDEDDDEEDAAMANDDELYAWEANPLEYEEKEEVVIDEERYHKDMTVKDLKAACEKFQLATSGSKKKLLRC